MRAALLLIAIAIAVLPPAARAADYRREELRIPMAAAGPRGLEALVVRPAAAGRYPLALISHGTSPDDAERRELAPYRFYRQAVEFARRGFAALVVMRRGYGDSGGVYAEGTSCCETATRLRSGRTAVDDLRAAIAAMEGRSDVSTRGMIAVGVSTGAFATLGLTADPPPGLAAAIAFAPGVRSDNRAATTAAFAHDQATLVEAFRTLGQTSRIPMLWVYAANDSFFDPGLAHRLHDAFTASGGRAQLIDAPAFGKDGHDLFADGLAIWPAMVDDFLRKQNLGLAAPLAPPSPPAIGTPPRLNADGRAAFAIYLASGPHKAFAVASNGAFGYWTGRRSLQDAQTRAMAGCAKYGPDCAIYANEDQLADTANGSR